ncbi:hypothetical protein [Kitasatospora sp. NPDC004272]
MPSTPPTENTENAGARPGPMPAATAEPGPPRTAAGPVPMRVLLAAGRAAEAVSTPPERRAA